MAEFVPTRFRASWGSGFRLAAESDSHPRLSRRADRWSASTQQRRGPRQLDGCLSAATAAGRRRDVELLADAADGAGLDLAVAGNGRDPLALGSTDRPHAVPGSFTEQLGSVSAQMTLQLAALHAAIVSSSDSLSAGSGSSGGDPNRTASSSLSASITFSRASPRVAPWLIAPRTCGIRATTQPSPSPASS